MTQKHRRRKRFRWPRRKKPEAPPGQLTPVPESARPVVRVFAYNENEFLERTIGNLDELRVSSFRKSLPLVIDNRVE